MHFTNEPLITPDLVAHLRFRNILCQSVISCELLRLRFFIVLIVPFQKTYLTYLHTLYISPTNQGM